MAERMKSNKHANLHLSSDNKSSTVSPNLRFIISEKFEIKDLENLKEINLATKIRDFKQIDQFLNYIESNNLNIFLPSDCFITVFHSLVRSWRWTDFRSLAKLIRDKEIDFSCNQKWKNDLLEKFVINIRKDEDDLDRDQIISLYSDLNNVLVDGVFDEEKEKDLIEDVRFVSSELKKVAVFTLDKIFSDRNTYPR